METQVPPVAHNSTRWIQLICGIVCMAMIANLQYGWTLFVDPIDAKHHWGRAAIQTAFTIFVVTETWLVPVEAWFVDRYGPRVVVLFGAIMISLAWVLNSYANSLSHLYLAAILAGMGAGAVYGTCVGNALKWFPDRRGLAAGATAAGFGAGAAITVVPIARMIASSGYESAFFWFGIGQGVIVFVLAWVLRKPTYAGPIVKRNAKVLQTRVDVLPTETIRKPVFWIMYAMFVMVASGGLMTAAQIGPIADDYKIANIPVNLLGLQMAALTMAISLDRILDGIGRPFFGWVSDNIGRENTMCIAFSIAAAALLAVAMVGQSPIVFVLATAIYFGVFGEIYSLFPATCGDTFGSKYAATNAGMLYTAKGVASILVPVASLIAAHYGWYAVFMITVSFNVIAAFMAMFVLKPVRAALLADVPATAGVSVAATAGISTGTIPTKARASVAGARH